MRNLRETGSALDIWVVHICGFLGVCLSYFSGHSICSKGLPEEVIELSSGVVVQCS
jgi:hypothetical protein